MILLPREFEFGKDLGADMALARVAIDEIMADPKAKETRVTLGGKEVVVRQIGDIAVTENMLLQVVNGKAIWQVKLDDQGK